MQRKPDWTNRFNALDSLDKPLYCAIEELSLNAKEEWAHAVTLREPRLRN